MKTKNLFSFILLCVVCISCSDDSVEKEKDVIVTIYEETGFGGSVMSNVLTEPLLFSDTDNKEVRTLTDIITEGTDIYEEYERGYRYTYKAKKIWMDPPPMDVSNVKYVFSDLISKEKIITKDSISDLTLNLESVSILFCPRFPYEYQDNGLLKYYEAMYVNIDGTNEWRGIIDIEGFDYVEGYDYKLKVREKINADPYSRSYSLIEVISKDEI